MKTATATPSWNVSLVIPAIGFWNRMMVKIPFLGERLLVMSNKMTGKILPNLTFLGFRNDASFDNAIWNWELFLSMIGADYDIGESSADSKLYIIKKCPAGYCRPSHLTACRATMALDHSLVESSGAKLMVEKRFPTDGVCVEKVVKK